MSWLALVGVFLAGFALGGALLALLRNRQLDRSRYEASSRSAAAEAALAVEQRNLREVEAELDEAQRSLREMDRQLAVAAEREARAREMIEELKTFAESSRKALEDNFKALAAEALAGSNKQFLQLAEQRLAGSEERARAELEERKVAIQTLLKPLGEGLKSLDQKTQEIEKARVDAYSRIDQQVQMLAEATAGLQEKATTLVSALKGSQVRGRWGEMALRRVAELAGMTEHCDFEEQRAVGDGKRPDMTVRLPGNRVIAVDAKAPLSAYLEAAEANDETARDRALERHVKALKSHIRSLAQRSYDEALDSDLDLVVMFLPGDPFLAAAFAKDPDLQVEALRSKVLIATPTTLLALLRTVAIYWQQRSMAENAEAIADTARELYERAAKFGEDLAKIGAGLGTALRAYNTAVGSFDRRLMPMSRKLEEMKVSEQSKRELKAPDSIPDEPRKLAE
ncbi:MAG: DNA recombination protein RmuC [Acidobacteriota bacterium]